MAIGDALTRHEHKCYDAKGHIDVLDVGTGSGISAILTAKNLGAKNVVAVDPSSRALQTARSNAEKNGVANNICFRQEPYSEATIAESNQCRVITMNPPYHLYPPEIEQRIPLHARGGILGFNLFREHLWAARKDVGENGVIAFHIMCLGWPCQGPEFVDFIPKILGGCKSFEWQNALPPISTYDFLSAVYGDRYKKWIDGISLRYSTLYFCNGIIKNDSLGHYGSRDIITSYSKEAVDQWQNRITLHRAIARHAIPDL